MAVKKADHPNQWLRAVHFCRLDRRSQYQGHDAANSQLREIPVRVTTKPACRHH
jgi:hypothetical protein